MFLSGSDLVSRAGAVASSSRPHIIERQGVERGGLLLCCTYGRLGVSAVRLSLHPSGTQHAFPTPIGRQSSVLGSLHIGKIPHTISVLGEYREMSNDYGMVQ